MTTLEVKGRVLRVKYQNEDTHFGVIIASIHTPEDNDDNATLVGKIPPLEVGDSFEAQLELMEHPEYGHQYKIITLILQLDTELTPEGMAAYLKAKISGVGTKLSQRIVNYFGTDTFDIIEQAPHKLLQVPGITQSTLLKIQSSWDEKYAERRIITGLQGMGLSINQANRALKEFGGMALDMVMHNIYVLTEVEGIGFLTADKIATAQGYTPTDERRLVAAALYTMQQAGQQAGHSYLPVERALKGLMHYTKVSDLLAESALETAIDLGKLMVEKNRVYLPYVYKTEVDLAEKIAELLCTPPEHDWIVSKEATLNLSDEQSQVLHLLQENSMVVLSGGPGTGKSYTTRKVVELAESLGLEVGLCAPTGKAARRLMEVTGHPTATIHRLLNYGMGGFRFNALEPLPFDVIVVDEISMCGDYLLLALLSAVAEGARILLVGDADQLPPVDYGLPLNTLTRVCPTVWLTQIYRQAQQSPIIMAAHRMKTGTAPEFSHSDLRHADVEPETGARRVALMVEALGGIEKVQVLSPMRKGPLGVIALNTVLQSMFNPGMGGTKVGEYTIRTGDIVVQTKNDYQNEVFNGTLGVVITDQIGKLSIDFEGNIVELSGAELQHLHLGYALTVHRAQGSEWDTVLMVLHECHYNMLYKELAYTALTRAKHTFVSVGSVRAWNIAASQQREARYSTLTDRVNARLTKGYGL